MYRNCIFCSARLGANEVIESFPVGNQLAFDEWKGRLWVVCPRCARWNLAPIEERWEPVEQAEKLFREARLRVQTENIGLSRLSDGTSLIRIGKAPVGELAAWRYGTRLIHRRNKFLLGTVAATAGLAALVASPILSVGTVVTSFVTGGLWATKLPTSSKHLRRIVFRLPSAPGEGDIIIRRWHVEGISVGPGESDVEVLVRDAHLDLPVMFDRDALANRAFLSWYWGVRRNSTDLVSVAGDEARALLRRAMILVNSKGAGMGILNSATQLLAESASAEQYLRHMANRGIALGARAADTGQIVARPAALALEMALNEESERRALEGELSALQAAWREAEEIAAIADSLPNAPVLPNSSS